jgi:hypothetical protein
MKIRRCSALRETPWAVKTVDAACYARADGGAAALPIRF